VSNKLNKIKYDKLLLELKFLEADLEYTKQVVNENKQLFDQECEVVSKKQGIWQDVQSRKAKQSKKGPPPVKQKKKKRVRKKDKELFKKIAKESHPDKLLSLSDEERKKKEKIFLEASSAMDEGLSSIIRSAALDLGIDPGELEESDLESLEQKIQQTSDNIKSLKRSVLWNWINQETAEKKEEITKIYLKFILTNLPE